MCLYNNANDPLVTLKHFNHKRSSLVFLDIISYLLFLRIKIAVLAQGYDQTENFERMNCFFIMPLYKISYIGFLSHSRVIN